jgi:lysophospholipase L1-like esterase
MTTPFTLRIGQGTLRPDIEAETLFLAVPDTGGTYIIPYIQDGHSLQLSAEFHDPSITALRVLLLGRSDTLILKRDKPAATLDNVPFGEHTLIAIGLGANGEEVLRATYKRIGVGTVIAALGDSITEGYWGRAVKVDDPSHLTANKFERQFVSRDGRNFPQFAPTAHLYRPEANCFESWMTDLNNLLSASLRRPVFIANEGWGGYTSADYLKLMRDDRAWQDRMHLLRPSVWLLHLGVNDERHHFSADAFGANIEIIVHTLISEYHASPRRILIARPSYDYEPGAEERLSAYCRRIEEIVQRLGLSHGPDFFEAYRRDRAVWYGTDPVHPNAEGMKLMGELWNGAIVHVLQSGENERR